jgi:hypothetical protein
MVNMNYMQHMTLMQPNGDKSLIASGGQGTLSEETAPWNPTKTFVYFYILRAIAQYHD